MLLFFALLLPISMVAMEQNNGVFSFKLQDVTVKDIFKYIEKNSEYIFLYSINLCISFSTVSLLYPVSVSIILLCKLYTPH